MDHSYGGGSWSMIPNIPVHSNPITPSNQDHLYVQQQQFHPQQQQQPQPQFQHQQQQQQFHHHQQQQKQQQQFNQQQSQQQFQQQRNQQLQQHHQSLASHFHLLHLVENLADAIENGTRDPHSDSLVTDMNSHFEKCQQLLNSISGSINAKTMMMSQIQFWNQQEIDGLFVANDKFRTVWNRKTVDGQKRKLEENQHLLNQRKDLIAKYRNSVEELIRSEP